MNLSSTLAWGGASVLNQDSPAPTRGLGPEQCSGFEFLAKVPARRPSAVLTSIFLASGLDPHTDNPKAELSVHPSSSNSLATSSLREKSWRAHGLAFPLPDAPALSEDKNLRVWEAKDWGSNLRGASNLLWEEGTLASCCRTRERPLKVSVPGDSSFEFYLPDPSTSSTKPLP